MPSLQFIVVKSFTVKNKQYEPVVFELLRAQIQLRFYLLLFPKNDQKFGSA